MTLIKQKQITVSKSQHISLYPGKHDFWWGGGGGGGGGGRGGGAGGSREGKSFQLQLQKQGSTAKMM